MKVLLINLDALQKLDGLKLNLKTDLGSLTIFNGVYEEVRYAKPEGWDVDSNHLNNLQYLLDEFHSVKTNRKKATELNELKNALQAIERVFPCKK